ncbi:MAG: hypothetical protein JXA28_07555 [Bacteroidetes bacterium]|nr:hypothetical protein [Bacteroidota bacterium]
MRISIILPAILLSLFLVSACGGDSGSGSLYDTPPNVKLYPIEKVKVTYEYGADASGSKVHIIANYGAYQRQEDRMSFTFNGEARNIHQLDIINDTVQYSVDLSSMTGTRSSFDTSRQSSFIRTFSEKERQDVQAAYILRGGGTKIGKDTVLDRECDLYEVGFQGIRVSLWNGVTLRMHVTMGGQNLVMTATEIDTDFEPTADMFLPPKDAKISEPKVISRFPDGHPPVDAPPPSDNSGDLPAGHPPVD